MEDRKREQILCDAANIVNSTTLVVSTVNPTGCTSGDKLASLEAICRQEGSDIMVLTETMLTRGREPITLVEDFKTFYNSVGSTEEGKRTLEEVCICHYAHILITSKREESNHKWGVAILVRKNIRVGSVIRGDGILQGRVIAIPTYYEALHEVKPLWILGIYGPTEVYHTHHHLTKYNTQ